MDLSDNAITALGHEELEVAPRLVGLNLASNRIRSIDAWLSGSQVQPTMEMLDLSRNGLVAISTPGPRMAPGQGNSISLPDSPVSPRRQPVPHDASHLGASERVGTALSASLPPGKGDAPGGDGGGEKPRGGTMVAPPRRVAEGWRPRSGSRPQAAARPTPLNTEPPSYSANHLISTHNPSASLDELRRARAARLAADAGGGAEGADDEKGEGDAGSGGGHARSSSWSAPAARPPPLAATPRDQLTRKFMRRMSSDNVLRSPTAPVSPVAPGARGMQYLNRVVPNLIRLRLAGNRLTSLRGLERLANLEELDVSYNRLETVRARVPLPGRPCRLPTPAPPQTGNLTIIMSMPKLAELLVAGNPVTATLNYRGLIACRAGKTALDAPSIDGQRPTDVELDEAAAPEKR